MSPAKDLGTKYVCWKCETKFYDLHKPVPVCPKCGADQRDSPPVKSTRASSRAAAKPARAKEVVAPAPVEEEEDALPADDEDDDEAEAEADDDEA